MLGIDICTHPTVSTILYAIIPFSDEYFINAVLKESYVRNEGRCWSPSQSMPTLLSVGHQSNVFVCLAAVSSWGIYSTYPRNQSSISSHSHPPNPLLPSPLSLKLRSNSLAILTSATAHPDLTNHVLVERSSRNPTRTASASTQPGQLRRTILPLSNHSSWQRGTAPLHRSPDRRIEPVMLLPPTANPTPTSGMHRICPHRVTINQRPRFHRSLTIKSRGYCNDGDGPLGLKTPELWDTESPIIKRLGRRKLCAEAGILAYRSQGFSSWTVLLSLLSV